jgi:pyruvate ferredoxin oxidoreductase gamma subunit
MTMAPFEIRIHGRGGQGVVTMAALLAAAAFDDGHEAQAFPSFGSERMGAPVMSFCRIANSPIWVRDPVTRPHAVVICDSTLLHHVDVLAGLPADGLVLLNSSRSLAELGVQDIAERVPDGQVLTIAASELARRFTGRPIPNAALLGAFAAMTGLISLAAVEHALGQRFAGRLVEANVQAARAAYEKSRLPEVSVDA